MEFNIDSKQSAGTIGPMGLRAILKKLFRTPNQWMLDHIEKQSEESARLRSQIADPAELAEIDRLTLAEYNRKQGLPEDTPLPPEVRRLVEESRRKHNAPP
jgi:hypothetical protein